MKHGLDLPGPSLLLVAELPDGRIGISSTFAGSSSPSTVTPSRPRKASRLVPSLET